ncbi:MAG: hypothetical protein Q8P80_04435 [Candidatus Levybacteria bacterium]|nr:hypothetical protein [Candidatus Levybacteria bacterium]
MARQNSYEAKKAIPRKINVKTETTLGSTYAQIVGVVVTDFDITLEFAYLNPRQGTEEAQVVARVTLPRPAAEGLAKTIIDIVAQHEAKKKEKHGTN